MRRELCERFGHERRQTRVGGHKVKEPSVARAEACCRRMHVVEREWAKANRAFRGQTLGRREGLDPVGGPIPFFWQNHCLYKAKSFFPPHGVRG